MVVERVLPSSVGNLGAFSCRPVMGAICSLSGMVWGMLVKRAGMIVSRFLLSSVGNDGSLHFFLSFSDVMMVSLTAIVTHSPYRTVLGGCVML